jgi:hypothetical protein
MPAPIIGALIGRLLASRIGASAISAASRAKGFGELAKPAAAAAESGEPSGGVLRRVASAVSTRAASLMGRRPNQPTPDQLIPRVTPIQPPVQPKSFAQSVAQNKNSFGSILSGRMTMAQATQQSQPQLQPGGGDAARQQQTDTAKNVAGKLNPGSMLLSGLKGASLAGGLLAGTFVSLVGISKKLADSQVEQLRHLKAFNGAIASSYGRLTRGELLRTRQQAAATSGSTTALVDAVNEMRDAWQPVQNIATNLMNTVGLGAVKLFTLLGKGLAVIEAIGRRLKIIAETPPPTAGPWQSTLNDLAKRYRDRNAPPKRGGTR